MKWIIFLTLFLLGSCKPYSLEQTRDRTPEVRDSEGGETEFEIPDIGEIGLDEIRASREEDCENYTNHTSQSLVLGDNSPFNPVVNCIAYNIDKGLKPLCELEKDVREQLEKTRDNRKEEELELYLDQIEVEKDQFIDYIYGISDPIYDACADLEDSIDDKIDDKIDSRAWRALTGTFFGLTFNSECHRIYRVMESKANSACANLNFSFRSRKN